MAKKLKQMKAVSLFSCAGVGHWYLKDLKIQVVVANEIIKNRAALYRDFYPDTQMICGDITTPDIAKKLIELSNKESAELLFTSCPCQCFSTAGQGDLTRKDATLFLNTIEHIKACNYKYILMENVARWVLARFKDKSLIGDRTIGEYLTEELDELGYNVKIEVQNSKFFGTAQSRERVFVLCSRKDVNPWNHPSPTTPEPLTLEDVIGDLESLNPGERGDHPLHYAQYIPKCQVDCLRETPTGERAKNPVNVDGSPSKAKFEDSFRRNHWDKPCPTVLTGSGAIGSHNTVHPGRKLDDGTYSNPRCFSLLEIIRITGLPDLWPVPLWARPNENLVRDCLGEAYMPLHIKAICEMLQREYE